MRPGIGDDEVGEPIMVDVAGRDRGRTVADQMEAQAAVGAVPYPPKHRNAVVRFIGKDEVGPAIAIDILQHGRLRAFLREGEGDGRAEIVAAVRLIWSEPSPVPVATVTVNFVRPEPATGVTAVIAAPWRVPMVTISNQLASTMGMIGSPNSTSNCTVAAWS